MKFKYGVLSVLSLLLSVLILSSCSGKTSITAGGATFPFTVYEQWVGEFGKKNSVKIVYQAIGSGAGQKNIKDGLLVFAGSDEYVTEKTLAEIRANGQELLQFPAIAGALVVVYNLKTSQPIKMEPNVVAEIFMGAITKWNDPKILATNAAIASELTGDITVVTRSDASGTTADFTAYLSYKDAKWAKEVGSAKSVQWGAKSTVASKGNSGVTNLVKNTMGAIGYVSLAYAESSQLGIVSLKNDSGNWVAPSSVTLKNAMEGMSHGVGVPISLFATKQPQGYPLSVVSYLLVMKDMKYGKVTEKEAKTTLDLFKWVLTSEEARTVAEKQGFETLPSALAKEVIDKVLSQVTYGGKAL